MEQLVKRISYLRGLADGMESSPATRESRILTEMIELLDDVCGELRALHARLEETEEYVEAVDEDLNDLEMLVYEDDLYEVVEDCEELAGAANESGYDLDDDEEAYVFEAEGDEREPEYELAYEFSCPTCQEGIALREGVDKEGFLHYVIEPTRREMDPINPT